MCARPGGVRSSGIGPCGVRSRGIGSDGGTRSCVIWPGGIRSRVIGPGGGTRSRVIRPYGIRSGRIKSYHVTRPNWRKHHQESFLSIYFLLILICFHLVEPPTIPDH